MGTLILVRHGQSEWNVANKFTGWTDVNLTEAGSKDARSSGNHLKEFAVDMAFTSRLKRAQLTLAGVLESMGQNPPIEKDSALNERHYGDLQGLDKGETAAKYGEDQVKVWRRSYDTPPPGGESMADCERRTMPFFMQYVWPHVLAGKTVLVAAHGNSLRPIRKFLEKLTKDEAATIETEFCAPYIYWVESDGTVAKREAREVPELIVKGGTSAVSKAK